MDHFDNYLAQQEEQRRAERRETWRGFWQALLALWPVLLVAFLILRSSPALDAATIAWKARHG